MEIKTYTSNFPGQILTLKLNIPQGYKQKCIDEIYHLGDSMNHKTNVKAIMTSYHIFDETKVLDPLLNNIIKSSSCPDPNFNLRLMECWGAIYKKGHYTIPHRHSPMDTSFIYYLKTTPLSSPLKFTGTELTITPQDDLLIIFPSHIFHEVPPQMDDEDRICLAGNYKWEPKK